MNTPCFWENVKVMEEGRVSIPEKVREILGVDPGDMITFIVEDGSVRIVNSKIYALQCLQEQMKGEAKEAGFFAEEDIDEWITQSRRE